MDDVRTVEALRNTFVQPTGNLTIAKGQEITTSIRVNLSRVQTGRPQHPSELAGGLSA